MSLSARPVTPLKSPNVDSSAEMFSAASTTRERSMPDSSTRPALSRASTQSAAAAPPGRVRSSISVSAHPARQQRPLPVQHRADRLAAKTLEKGLGVLDLPLPGPAG